VKRSFHASSPLCDDAWSSQPQALETRVIPARLHRCASPGRLLQLRCHPAAVRVDLNHGGVVRSDIFGCWPRLRGPGCHKRCCSHVSVGGQPLHVILEQGYLRPNQRDPKSASKRLFDVMVARSDRSEC